MIVDAPLRVAIELGLAPVTVGLVLSSGYILARTADKTWSALAVTIATVGIMLTMRIHPLWLLAAGATLGAFGLLLSNVYHR